MARNVHLVTHPEIKSGHWKVASVSIGVAFQSTEKCRVAAIRREWKKWHKRAPTTNHGNRRAIITIVFVPHENNAAAAEWLSTDV